MGTTTAQDYIFGVTLKKTHDMTSNLSFIPEAAKTTNTKSRKK